MSLQQVNSQLLAEKADVVARCLDRIKAKCPATLADLEANLDAQDIIVLNLERAVQACVDIASHVIAYTALPTPQTMAESFICLQRAGLIEQRLCDRMVKSVGLRNLLVHEYQRVDWAIVWQVVQLHLVDLIQFAQRSLSWNSIGS